MRTTTIILAVLGWAQAASVYAGPYYDLRLWSSSATMKVGGAVTVENPASTGTATISLLGASGVVAATSFTGSGSALTGIPTVAQLASTAAALSAHEALTSSAHGGIATSAQLTSTASALTAEITRSTDRDIAIGLSTSSIYSTLNSTAIALSDHQALLGTAHGGVIPSSATGNYLLRVATATYLATAPGTCSAGDFITGLAADGTKTCGTPAPGGITALTGDVTASGSGSVVATVVTNANLTGPVTSIGNATTIAGPIPVAKIDLSTVTSQLLVINNTISTAAYKSGDNVFSASNTFTSSVTIGGTLFPQTAGTLNYRLVSDGQGGASWQPPSSEASQVYMGDGASDITGYGAIIPVHLYTPVARSTLTVTNPPIGMYISSMATPVGYPGVTLIPAGEWRVHVHLIASANTVANRMKVKCELYTRTAAGVEADLDESEESIYIPTTETEFDFTGVMTSTAIASDTRIVGKLKVTAKSGTVNLTVIYGGIGGPPGGETGARMVLPAQTVDALTYVPYTGATSHLNMGAYDVSAGSITGKHYGDGSQLTGITGSGDVVLAATQTFTGTNTFSKDIKANGGITASSASITGPLGANVTYGLTAGSITLGGVTNTSWPAGGAGDAVLASTQTFTGGNTFSGAVNLPTKDKITFSGGLVASSSTLFGSITAATSFECLSGSSVTMSVQSNSRVMINWGGIGSADVGQATFYVTQYDGNNCVNNAAGQGYVAINTTGVGYQNLGVALSCLTPPLTAGVHGFCAAAKVSGGAASGIVTESGNLSAVEIR